MQRAILLLPLIAISSSCIEGFGTPASTGAGSQKTVLDDRIDRVLTQKGWTRMLVPRAVDVFDVGTVLDSEQTQKVRDTIEAACGKGPASKRGPGSSITENASSTLTASAEAGLSGTALAAWLPNLKVSAGLERVAKVEVTYSDVEVVQTTQSNLRKAACGCGTKIGTGTIAGVSGLLLGKFTITFLDKAGQHVDVDAGWKNIHAKVEVKLDKQQDGKYASDTPVVFGYQTLGFDVAACDETVITGPVSWSGKKVVDVLVFDGPAAAVYVPAEQKLELDATELRKRNGGEIRFLGVGFQPVPLTASGAQCPNCASGFDFVFKTKEEWEGSVNKCKSQSQKCEHAGDSGAKGPTGSNGSAGATIVVRTKGEPPADVFCDVRPGCGGDGGPGGPGKNLDYPGKGQNHHNCDGCKGGSGSSGAAGTCSFNGTNVQSVASPACLPRKQ